MPEGPQVRRAGDIIAAHVGHSIEEIVHPPSRTPWELTLPVEIIAVEVVGKNIFIRLANGQVIYNHMLMWGSWRPTCEVVGKKRLNTCFKTSLGCLGYFGGGILRLLSAEEAAEIAGRLGVDMMTARGAPEAFVRVRESRLTIGEALLAQELVAGIGNIYKSEGLFAAKIHPLRAADKVLAAEYERLFKFLRPQMRADSKRPGPITTTTRELVRRGVRTFVYRRYHQPCLICGTKIERIYQGQRLARSTYFCPHCQPAKR